MHYVTCKGCGSQFDGSNLAVGTTFKCGKCGGLVTVEPPTMQPIESSSNAPATVVLTPDQMRAALAKARGEPAATPAPTQPAARKAPAEQRLPKAMQKRAQQKSQRAGSRSAQPAAAAAKPKAKSGGKAKSSSKRGSRAAASGGSRAQASSGRSSGEGRSSGGGRSSSRRDSGSSEKKPPVGLYAGIGVGVLALAGVGFMLMGNKGEEPTDTGTTPETATTEGANAGDTASGISSGDSTDTPGPQDEWDAFNAMSRDEQETKTLNDIEAVKQDKAKLIELGKWLQHEKLASNGTAKKRLNQVVDLVIALDTTEPWAREAKGQKNPVAMLEACKNDNPVSFNYPDADENDLIERLDELNAGSPWVDAAAYAELEALVGRIAERNAALADNPRLQDIEKEKDWVRKNPLFEGMEVISRVADPYVLFQTVKLFKEEGKEHMNEQRREKAELYASRQAILFQELHTQYRNYFAERFSLPVQSEVASPMRALILWDREDFVEFHKGQDNAGIVNFARAYYTPGERRIVNYMGTDALTAQDEIKCAEGQVQKGFDQVVTHEGLHQLMHEYQAISMGQPLSETHTPNLGRKSMWFDEGWAEVMGGMEYQDDKEVIRTLQGAKFRHGRILLERVGQMKRHRKGGSKFWTIADLVQPNHNGELMQKSGELHPANAQWMANIFYGQSWALASFFLFYDNGKYRDKFMEYGGHYLKNTHSPEKLAEIFGKKVGDWGEIEDEWQWYYNKCMNRNIGQKRDRRSGAVIGGWFYPETSPPEGRMEDDADESDEIDFGD